MQASYRNPKLSHLVEALPTLWVQDTDKPYAQLRFSGKVAQCYVNSKLLNKAETDYHAAVVHALMNELISGDCKGILADPWDEKWGKLAGKPEAEAPAPEPKPVSKKAPAKKRRR